LTVALAASCLTCTPAAVNAQQAPGADITARITELREAPDVLGSRAATLQQRVERKRRFLSVLRQRVESARAETDEKLRAHRVSRYAYQAFFLTSRIAAEESKLSEIQGLLPLAGRVSGADGPALVRKVLEEGLRRRATAAGRLLQEAEQYRTSITEATFKAQFEQLLSRIQADRNVLVELR
jgi:hypothetical protein